MPDYLTQTKLQELLSQHFQIKKEVPVKDSRFRSDIQVDHDGVKYAVEFDGDSHYCDVNVMNRDVRKDRLLTEQGFNVVRIPYWVQLDNITFRMFFRFDFPSEIVNHYPHGFIDKKAKTPAFFCVNGMYKFICMMNYMAEKYTPVFDDIIKSFCIHLMNTNMDDVIPIRYGYPDIKGLLLYLSNRDDTCECRRGLYSYFLKLPHNKYPNCSIENTIEC